MNIGFRSSLNPIFHITLGSYKFFDQIKSIFELYSDSVTWGQIIVFDLFFRNKAMFLEINT